jgi:hypothetical protein
MIAPVRRVLEAGNLFGLNFARMVRSAQGIPKLVHDSIQYNRQAPPASFRLKVRRLKPMLSDYRGQAGTAKGQYFHQDLWAARRIFQRHPPRHLDIGSRIDGFIAHLLVFMDVEVIDVLALNSTVTGLSFQQEDATSLAGLGSNSIISLSSLHAAEHFGLGRYSDPIDPWAHTTFMSSLQRVLSPGGVLYFSVPIGHERLEFNAHRIFDVSTVLTQFKQLRLMSFSYVDDMGDLHEGACPSDVPRNTSCGCGLFEFTKE